VILIVKLTTLSSKKEAKNFISPVLLLLRHVYPGFLFDVKICAFPKDTIESWVTAQFDKFDNISNILRPTEFA